MRGTRKTPVDWESIEAEYRLGIDSIRSIADKYNVNDAAVCRYAKRRGWKRDLTQKVQQSTKTKLTSLQVSTEVSKVSKVSTEVSTKKKDDRLVDETSDEFSESLCKEQQELLNKEESLVDQASNVTVGIVLKHRQKINNCQNLFDKVTDFLKQEEITNDNYNIWTRTLNTGVDALSKAIKLERQAYNMEDNATTEEVTSILDLIENETMAVTREYQAQGQNEERTGETGKT